MRIQISGKNMDISEAMRELVEKKMNKLGRYFKPDTLVNITMSVEQYRHIIEITIPIDGITLRAEEVTNDMYTSIDKVLAKLERQIRKHRTKLEKRLHETAFVEAVPVYYEHDDEDDEDGEQLRVVRSKTISLKPMDAEEAVLQMELLGHSFFVFMNIDTDMVGVVYKRNNGTYGLIEPEYA